VSADERGEDDDEEEEESEGGQLRHQSSISALVQR